MLFFLIKNLFLTFEEYTNKIKLFSGNLDARKINKICEKYGISCLTNDKQEKLLEVKIKRNQLAHGEVSYKFACRNMTVDDIKKLNDCVYQNLFELSKNVERYIENKEFLSK
ncbi:MAG: hypothetical protein HDR32_03290 [Treponema sp.]|nr:hypothetical protein [Treponema sp.]